MAKQRPSVAERASKALTARPRIGLALGAGAARGLAHIVVLEAFDEIGVKPAVIAGASMGALIGAAHASGIAAAELREHVLGVLGDVRLAAKRIFQSGGVRAPLDLLNFSFSRPLEIDGAALVELFAHEDLKARIEDMGIPLRVVAADYYAAEEVVFDGGDTRAVLAASIAVPGLISAPEIDGRLLIDGGIINPVPFDHVRAAGCDLVIGVDVTGQPVKGRRAPGSMELVLGASQIMQQAISTLKRRLEPPDVWIRPPVNGFRAYDLTKAKDILAAAEPAREDMRRVLAAVMERM